MPPAGRKGRGRGRGAKAVEAVTAAPIALQHHKYNDVFEDQPSPTARLDSLVALAGSVGDRLDVEDNGALGPTSAGGNRRLPKRHGEGVANLGQLFDDQQGAATAGLRSDNHDGTSAAAAKPSTRGVAKSAKGAAPPPPTMPAKSPPVTPNAAAAAAAAAAARAECQTYLSGEQEESADKDKSGRAMRSGSTRATRSTAHTKAGAEEEEDEDYKEEESTAGAAKDAADGGDLDDGKQEDASRRSSRRRSANPRFEPYHTKGLDLSPKSRSPSNRKKDSPGSVLDQEEKLDSVLARMEHNYGANHPEVGKVLLQLARLYFAAGGQEKAEHYLKRSWDVYKAHADLSCGASMQHVFDSYQLLFEDYNCSPECLDSLRRDMFVLSPARVSQDLKMAWASIPTPRSMDMTDSISGAMAW